MRRAIALALCTQLGGCAMMFSERVDEHWMASQGEPRCSDPGGLVALDALGAILGGVAVGLEYKANSEADDAMLEHPVSTVAMLGTGGIVLLHAVSVIAGSGISEECKDARLKRDVWVAASRRPAKVAPAAMPAAAAHPPALGAGVTSVGPR